MTDETGNWLSDLEWTRALCARLVFDRSTSDDLAQEVWRAALQSRPDHGVPIRAWLTGIAHNLARMARRSTTRRDRRERTAARRDEVPDTARLVAAAESQQRVLAAVNALPMPMREVVLLRFYEGLPPRAIAARLQIPVATVRTRLSRAQETLREQLDRDFGDRRLWVLALATLPRPHHVAAAAGTFATVVPLSVAVMTTHKLLVVAAAVLVLVAVPTAVALSAPGSLPTPPDWGIEAPVAAIFERTDRTTTAPDENTSRTIQPAPARAVRGRVLDETGAPIASAIVRQWPRWLFEREIDNGKASMLDLESRTGDDGTFTLHPGTTSDKGVHVEVTHADHVARKDSWFAPFDTESTLTMLRTFTVPLEVTMTDRNTGLPVPSFSVSATSWWRTGEEPEGAMPGGQFSVPSDARGQNGIWRGEARCLVGKPMSVRADCAGAGAGEFGDLSAQALRSEVQPVAGVPIRIAFEVDMGAAERLAPVVQRGRVVGARSGEPLVGVTLRSFYAIENGTRSPRAVQSGADGSFALALPKDGTACTILLDDHLWQAGAQDADAERELLFSALPLSSLRIVVLDGNEAPVAGAHALITSSTHRDVHERRRTGDDGAFELPGLLAGRYTVWIVPNAGDPDENAIANQTYAVEAGATSTGELHIEVPDAVRVFGNVIGGPGGLVPVFVPVTATGRWYPAKSAGRGYDAGGVAKGSYVVVLRNEREDRSAPVVLLAGVEVRGAGAQAMDLVVPTGSVRGRLVDVEAATIAEMRVVAVPANLGNGMAADMVGSEKFARWCGIAVAADGSFEVPFVGDGEWSMRVYRGAVMVAERAVRVRGSADVGEWRVRG